MTLKWAFGRGFQVGVYVTVAAMQFAMGSWVIAVLCLVVCGFAVWPFLEKEITR